MFKIIKGCALHTKVVYLFLTYLIFGLIINYLVDYRFFSFLYENGFIILINFIFKDNVVFIGNHLKAADINFYYI